METPSQPELENQSQQRGGNQLTVRSYNEQLILELVRKNGALSKSDAARLTGLSNNAASVILRALEEASLLLKCSPVRGKVGQPSIPMAINPRARHYLALRIGRRSIEFAALNFAGEIIALKRQNVAFPTPALVETFLRDHHAAVLRRAKLRKAQIDGFSIVTPFELWSWTDDFDAPIQQMLAWKHFDLVGMVQNIAPYRTIVENDGTAACRAELIFGKHPHKRDWIYFYVGTFIGGGVVLDGKLFTGRNGNAGGFGPMRVPEQFGRDRLVDHASLVVLERALAEADKNSRIPLEDLDDWTACQPQLDAWMKRAAHSLAHAIVSSLAIIDFEGVVIDGAMPAKVKSDLVAAVVGQLAIIDVQGVETPQVEPGQVGPTARLLGAAAMQIDQMFDR